MIKNSQQSRLNEDINLDQLVSLTDDYSVRLAGVLDQARLIADSGRTEVANYVRRYTIPHLERLLSLTSFNGSLPQIQKLVNKEKEDTFDDEIDLSQMSYPDYEEMEDEDESDESDEDTTEPDTE